MATISSARLQLLYFASLQYSFSALETPHPSQICMIGDVHGEQSSNTEWLVMGTYYQTAEFGNDSLDLVDASVPIYEHLYIDYHNETFIETNEYIFKWKNMSMWSIANAVPLNISELDEIIVYFECLQENVLDCAHSQWYYEQNSNITYASLTVLAHECNSSMCLQTVSLDGVTTNLAGSFETDDETENEWINSRDSALRWHHENNSWIYGTADIDYIECTPGYVEMPLFCTDYTYPGSDDAASTSNTVTWKLGTCPVSADTDNDETTSTKFDWFSFLQSIVQNPLYLAFLVGGVCLLSICCMLMAWKSKCCRCCRRGRHKQDVEGDGMLQADGNAFRGSIKDAQELITPSSREELVKDEQREEDEQKRHVQVEKKYKDADDEEPVSIAKDVQIPPPPEQQATYNEENAEVELMSVPQSYRKKKESGDAFDSDEDVLVDSHLNVAPTKGGNNEETPGDITSFDSMQVRDVEAQFALNELTLNDDFLKIIDDGNQEPEHELKEYENVEPAKETRPEWMDWNYNDVFIWITGLDMGMFREYAETLHVALQQHDVKGEDLKTVEYLEIEGWGIDKVQHIQLLQRHIYQLTHGLAST